MDINNGILLIDSTLDNDELLELSHEIFQELDNIKEVKLDTKIVPSSSAIFSLLVSIKKSNESIKIDILDNDKVDIAELGNIKFITKGK